MYSRLKSGSVRGLKLLVALLWLASATAWADSHRGYRAADLVKGEELFKANCAVCHGERAEGIVSDWRKRDADGKLPPPPLNGTAHTWHHTVPVLFRTIRDGTIQLGGSMPAHGEKLNRDEILLVISWLTSLWPDEIYNNWLQMHQQ